MGVQLSSVDERWVRYPLPRLEFLYLRQQIPESYCLTRNWHSDLTWAQLGECSPANKVWFRLWIMECAGFCYLQRQEPYTILSTLSS